MTLITYFLVYHLLLFLPQRSESSWRAGAPLSLPPAVLFMAGTGPGTQMLHTDVYGVHKWGCFGPGDEGKPRVRVQGNSEGLLLTPDLLITDLLGQKHFLPPGLHLSGCHL